ncbi:MAG: LysM peptidoglycan-binding domain-containing protein, partial [Bacteroidales bacterium]|nr:LysM peptidoglycan-binding domain-containing protein [Bacteroidales bacterium]
MKRHILILIAILLTSVVLAQQVPISEEKVIIDGQKFYLHTVEKGHTLYSIGKAYSVDTEIIEEYNHGAIEGLKLGQILKIPIIETSLNEGVDLSRDEVNFIYHTVKRKETVY